LCPSLDCRHPTIKFSVYPLTLRVANEFVAKYHRHNKQARGHRFSLGAMWGDKLFGVAIVGRPISRMMDDGLTAEVTRVCVSETAPKNTISYLYGKIWRVWQQMGGKRMITYTLKSESGSTMKAVGWKMIGETDKVKKGKGWTNRPGREWQEVSDKIKKRWIIEC
jgi:hypothetical protein